jgi:sortase A
MMRRAIAGVGRTLVTLGLLILLFVVYQLWGTGIFTARAQTQLKRDFERQLEQVDNPVVKPTTTTRRSASTVPRATTSPTVRTVQRSPSTIPDFGEVEGKINIPKIGLDIAFVEGVGLDQLRKGPGHYQLTPLPGELGNAAIAGHRTTYLHPFFRINELKKGDKIIITMLDGKFTYAVTEQLIVRPTDISVLSPPTNPLVAELTLTACHPRYSAEQRIVIHALLVPNESAKPSKPRPKPKRTLDKTKSAEDALQEGLGGDLHGLAPALAWGGFAAFVGAIWWWGFRRWRHPITWLIGVVPFLVALFPFYVYLDRAVTPLGH